MRWQAVLGSRRRRPRPLRDGDRARRRSVDPAQYTQDAVQNELTKLAIRSSYHEFYPHQIGRVAGYSWDRFRSRRSFPGDVVDVDSDRAIFLACVAEPALGGAGNPACLLISRESHDQRAHVGDELGIDRGGRAPDVGVGVPHLAAGVFAPELREGPGDRVLVEADLGMVG